MTHTPTREQLHAEVLALGGRMTKAVSDLHGLVVNDCLGTESLVLDANGLASRTFRVPFGSLAVHNGGASTATVANAGPAGQAPAQGTGVVPIPAGIAATINVTGREWTIYGTAGARVVVSTFSKPQPPAWANLGAL